MSPSSFSSFFFSKNSITEEPVTKGLIQLQAVQRAAKYPRERIRRGSLPASYKRWNLIMHSDEAPFIMPRGESISKQKRFNFFFFPFVIFPFNASRKAARSLVSRTLTSGDSSEEGLTRVPEDSHRTKRRFPCSPFLYKAQSFYRDGLQESCPEFEIPSSPENRLIDASTGQISRVHERLIIPSSANNSASFVVRRCSYFLIRRFYRQFYGKPGGYVDYFLQR